MRKQINNQTISSIGDKYRVSVGTGKNKVVLEEFVEQKNAEKFARDNKDFIRSR